MSQSIASREFLLPAVPAYAINRASAAHRLQRKIRMTVMLGGGLACSTILGGALIPLGGAVVASGQVDVSSRVKRVAHPRGGVVSAILVRDGQHVEKGQILARLDDTVPGAETRLTGLTIDQLVAQRARLAAEADGQAAIQWPAELAGRTDAAAQDAIRAERQLFDSRRAEAAEQRAQLAARIGQYQASLASYQAQLSSLRRQSTLIQPERNGIDQLYQKGLIPVSRRNQIERSAMELDGNIGALEGSIAETRGKIVETRAMLAQQGDTRRADAGTQLAALNATLNQQRITAANATDERDRMLIRAPYPGVISHLQIAGAGEVIQPNEPFAEIVPDRDHLLVEATINPADIDQMRVGQTARIRFSSFNRAVTPEIPGTVLFVGPNRTNSPDGKTSFYIARVAIDATALAAQPAMKLRPGMPAEVYVTTGSRSLLSYILKPLTDQFARALKD